MADQPPPQADLDAARAQLDKGIDDIGTSVTDLGSAFDDLNNRVSRLIQDADRDPNPFPAAVIGFIGVDNIRAQLADANAKTETLQGHGNSFVAGAPPIFSLIDTAIAWAIRVKGPLSGLATTARLPSADSLYHWTGPAATAYGDKRIIQQGAISATDALVGGIASWLGQIVVVNANFVTEVALIFIDVVKTALAAALKITGVITIPNAISGFADTIAGAIALIGSTFVRYTQALLQSEDLRITAETLLNSNNGFEGDKWPNAVR
jgi:hypothetical protein